MSAIARSGRPTSSRSCRSWRRWRTGRIRRPDPPRSPPSSASGLHLVRGVDGDAPDAGPAEAQRHARLLDRAVRLGRGVDAQSPLPGRPRRRRASPVDRLAGRRQGDQARRRGRVGEEAVERLGQAEGLGGASRRSTSSSSVAAGDVRHSIALATSVAISISPRMPGPGGGASRSRRRSRGAASA